MSSHEIQKLGKRLRDGSGDLSDYIALEEFRDSFDDLLIDTSATLDAAFAQAGIRALLSGRSKRTKSIVRKLRRPQNHGMDLSRMGDIVGLRAIVGTMDEQDRALDAIAKHLELKSPPVDYRSRTSGYRSIHAYARRANQQIEIQLRTIPQHVWAVESEAFGEQAKEGTLSPEVRDYLEALTIATERLDSRNDPHEEAFAGLRLFESRRPLSWLYPYLRENFFSAAATYEVLQVRNTTILVFDNQLGQLLHRFNYVAEERKAALARYRGLSRTLTDVRFEQLIFNSSSEKVLRVTHPRFYVS